VYWYILIGIASVELIFCAVCLCILGVRAYRQRRLSHGQHRWEDKQPIERVGASVSSIREREDADSIRFYLPPKR
jgi:hypothetical protein